jgi:hypothetical protein
MRAKLIPPIGLGWFAVTLALLAGGQFSSQAADMKLQAVLLWGTDDSKPPEGKAYKPVDPEIRQKLKDLPLKWTNWFEVNRKDFVALPGAVQQVAMSEKCQLNVRRIIADDLEVSLIGKGKEVVRRKQSLPKGEMLVLGGNAPNSTAWLVVLKRLQ